MVLEILSSVVNDGIREFYTFLREDPTGTKTHKAQKAQKVTFFVLDVFMRTKIMSFVFLFAYVRFALFVRVGSFRKRYKTP